MERDSGTAEILIIDDTLESLRLLANMLEASGFEVRPVTSGREALTVIAHMAPDLVLLDVSMPEMDGFEVCAKLKEDKRLRDVPVIFITALNQLSDKVKGFAAGGNDYITKPFQVEEVLARVSNHIGLRRARRELSEKLDELRGLERLRDDLVHMVVHDMRAPLTAMAMNLQYLLDRGASGEQKEVLGELVVSADALTRMANTLLDVSRLEHGSMPLELREHDLVKLADEVCNALSALEPERSIELRAHGPVIGRCDAGIIRRVLENLVSNGIKHTPPGRRLSVEVSALPAGTRVVVEDEGPGIAEHARARLFEKFGTLQAREERAYHSVGLGLAFCKLAVQAHGGSIGVASATPRGSRFWFELPA